MATGTVKETVTDWEQVDPGDWQEVAEQTGKKAGLNPTSGAVGRFFAGAATELGVPGFESKLSPQAQAGMDTFHNVSKIAAPGFPLGELIEPTLRNVFGQAASGNLAGAAGAGLTAAASYGGPELLAKTGLPGLLERSAERQYGQVLSTTKQVPKAIAEKNVIPGALDRNLVIFSREGMKDRAVAESEAVMTKIDAAWNALPPTAKTKAQPIYDAAQKIIDDSYVKGTKVVENEEKKAAAEAIQEKLADLMDSAGDVSLQTINDWRKKMDRFVFKHKGFYVNSVDAVLGAKVEVKRDVTNTIRRILADDATLAKDKIAQMNAEFTFWQNFEDILTATATRNVGQQKTVAKIKTAVVSGLGASIGGYAGHPVIGTALGAGLELAMSTPAWKTASAITKAKLAKALVDGDAAKAGVIIGQFTSQLPEMIAGPKVYDWTPDGGLVPVEQPPQ